MPEGRTQKAENTLIQSVQRLVENKKVQLVLALVLVLLAIRLYFPTTAPPDAQLVQAPATGTQSNAAITSMQQYQDSLQKQLESVLGQIKGAGQVTVMLSLASTSDIELAANTQVSSHTTEEKDAAGMSKTTTEETHSSQPVMARTTGGDSVVKLKELTPKISGVAVIASGANDAKIQAALTHAVQTILSLPAHRVRVFPGK